MSMTYGGRRNATAWGAMLSDPTCLGNVAMDPAERLFDPDYWRSRGELAPVSGGRGAAWFIESNECHWVLRHYRRGGFMARFSEDRYMWRGEDRVRAFAEWRLLDVLKRRGLPVPTPVAARYQRTGPCYRCDLITQRVIGAQPLSAALRLGVLSESTWRTAGGAVARLHAAGADHADLNAHNLLLDPHGTVTVIDFDRGRLRALGKATMASAASTPGWAARNLRRLKRSLDKIAAGLPADRLECTWQWFLDGYRAG